MKKIGTRQMTGLVDPNGGFGKTPKGGVKINQPLAGSAFSLVDFALGRTQKAFAGNPKFKVQLGVGHKPVR